MAVACNDDRMWAQTQHAAHNLAVLQNIPLNLIRLDPTKRNGARLTDH